MRGVATAKRAAAGLVAALAVAVCAAADSPEQVQIDFADGLFQRGFYEMAADAYREYLEKYPDGEHVRTALHLLGECEYYLREFDAALASLNKLLELEAKGLTRQRALLRKGEVLYRLQQGKEAAPVLEELTGEGIDPEVRAEALFYLGKLCYESDQLDKAQKAFDTLIESLQGSPLVPYARYQLAFVYLSQGQPENAATEFTAVANSGADEALRVESRFRAAETYDQIGWYDAAVVAYQKLREDFPGSQYADRAVLGHAWALYHAGKYGDASKLATEYIEKQPDSASIAGMKYLQANCVLEQKDYANALGMFQAIREQYPDSQFSGRAAYKVAWTHFLSGDLDAAKAALKVFFDTYKDSPLMGEAAFLRGSVLAAEKNYEDAHEEFRLVAEKYPESEFGPEALYKVGECLAQLGRMEEAAAVFESFAEKYPHNILAKDALLRVGDAEFFSASFEKAIAKYQHTLETTEDPAIQEETLFRMAITYHNMQKFKESADTFAALLERFPESAHAAEANLRLGDYFLYEAKDPVKSIAPHETAYKADPKGPFAGRALKGLALARYETNDHDDAVKLFLQVMTDYPAVELNEQAYAWVGEYLFEREQWEQAAVAFGAMLRAIPDYPNPERVRFRIAECSERAGTARGAIELYGAVVEEAPRSASAVQAKYRMARLHETLNEMDEAMRLYEEAADTNTGDTAARARFRVGELLEAKEDYVGAAKSFMFVAIVFLHEELSPEALWRAGQCREKSGSVDQAKRAYQDVIAEFPDSPQAEKAQARLAELG
ncbi:MAG: tetratricopeptide repeat protein [Candidatus Hydrogenedentes bacterium]|nr:tetratricopeptide repeat protein [Candidatus Hydrogenedentota bacterium]